MRIILHLISFPQFSYMIYFIYICQNMISSHVKLTCYLHVGPFAAKAKHIFHSATESAAVIIKQLDNVHKKNMINLSPRYCALNFQKCSTLNYVRKFSLWMLTTLWLVEVKPGFGAQKKCPFPLNRGLPLIKVTNTKIMWTFFVE